MFSSGNSMGREMTGAGSWISRNQLKDTKVKHFKEKRYKDKNTDFKF